MLKNSDSKMSRSFAKLGQNHKLDTKRKSVSLSLSLPASCPRLFLSSEGETSSETCLRFKVLDSGDEYRHRKF